MKCNSKKLTLFGVLGGILLALFTVAGVYLLDPLELKVFWAGNVITLLVFLITIDDSRKKNKELSAKIDNISLAVKRIEDKLDGKDNHEKNHEPTVHK